MESIADLIREREIEIALEAYLEEQLSVCNRARKFIIASQIRTATQHIADLELVIDAVEATRD